MDSIFFSSWQSLLRILIMSITAYISIVFILRVSGKRVLSKMNAFDFIVTIALGSSFATVILNKDIALAEGILAFFLLVVLQLVVSWLTSRFKVMNKLVKSTPRLVVYKGEMMQKNMLDERINDDEIYAAIRKSGQSSLAAIDAMVLETDGTLTVIKKLNDDSQVIERIKK